MRLSKLPSVVVTRPQGQADALIAGLQALGLSVQHCPLIDIVPIDDDHSPQAQQLRSLFLDIDQYYAVVSVSRNAADIGLRWLDRYWPQWPTGIHWIAVGPATAEVLLAAQLPVEQPLDRFDSEGMLALPCMAAEQVAGKKVLLWRGLDGRETMAQVLRARGAIVEYAGLYHRPERTDTNWPQRLHDRPLLLLSSGQGLAIVQQQVPDLAQRVAGILVPSERVAEMARAQGFQTVLVAASACDDDTLASVAAWSQQ
ncbi:MAG: uroporphyrinogen-III synthase [Bacterioplanes sp.]|nr:uroporphyrinogen-III synthase [Bacterioplanes sp.]